MLEKRNPLNKDSFYSGYLKLNKQTIFSTSDKKINRIWMKRKYYCSEEEHGSVVYKFPKIFIGFEIL